jgi:hypothetical protein
MKQYTGTKTLMAKPMTLGDYCDLRYLPVPPEMNPGDPGYLVEYQDGGEPNHPDFKGYISWSPAEVFEKIYWPSESHEDRVKAELNELEVKLIGLGRFLETETYEALPERQRVLLRRQFHIMGSFREVLEERIEEF